MCNDSFETFSESPKAPRTETPLKSQKFSEVSTYREFIFFDERQVWQLLEIMGFRFGSGFPVHSRGFWDEDLRLRCNIGALIIRIGLWGYYDIILYL